MTEFIHAVLLGIIQGISEFLPISSSAHLLLYSEVLALKELPISLNIALHLGTALAVLCYFYKDWILILNEALAALSLKSKKHEISFTQTRLYGLFIASLPAGLIGIFYQDLIEQWFHHPKSTLLPLAFVGVLMWLVDKSSEFTHKLEFLGIWQQLLIGVAQATALIPGVSRSGATMIAARFLKLSRQDAAKYSFLLGTPAMLGAALLNYKEIIVSIFEVEFYVGVLVSFVVGLLSIKFLLHYVARYSFASFAVYRVILALVIYISLLV